MILQNWSFFRKVLKQWSTYTMGWGYAIRVRQPFITAKHASRASCSTWTLAAAWQVYLAGPAVSSPLQEKTWLDVLSTKASMWPSHQRHSSIFLMQRGCNSMPCPLGQIRFCKRPQLHSKGSLWSYLFVLNPQATVMSTNIDWLMN